MRKFAFASMSMFLLLAACTKKDNPVDPPPTKTVYHGFKGAPTGVATTKSIGATGGTISTPDNVITVTVPAGAVSATTEFSIQPITNSAPNGLGAGYRLLPEGLHFAQPVTITFHYNDALVEGTLPDLLSIAYQDGEGVWQGQNASTLNTANNTISVTSTHFSDWSVLAQVRVTVDKPSIDFNEMALLGIREIAPSMVAALDGSTPLDTASVKDIQVAWSKNSSGQLMDANVDASYTAPATLPSPNPVTITAKVTHTSGSTKTLTRKIYVGKPYFEVVYNNITNIYPNAEVYAAPGYIQLTSTNAAGNGGSIIFPGAGAGTYRFGGSDGSGALVTLKIGGDVLKDSYVDCSRKIIQLGGSITVSTWGEPGEYIEGTFSGNVTLQNTCSPVISAVTGRFRARRIY